MKEEIDEVLNVLNKAKEKRQNRLNDLANCDDTAVLEEKRKELEKELEEKLKQFKDNISAEREKEFDKLNRDIETIDEIIGEYEDELPTTNEQEQPEEKENADAVATESYTYGQTLTYGNTQPNHEYNQNPFRP